MASPELLRSSPVCVVRSVSQRNTPSSPDLPSLQEIFSQGARQTGPNIDESAVAALAANQAPPPSQSRSVHRHQTQSRQATTPEPNTEPSKNNGQKSSASSQSIVEIVAAPTQSTPTRKRSANDTSDARASASPATASVDKPWRKYKSKTKPFEMPKASPPSNAAPHAPLSTLVEREAPHLAEQGPESSDTSKGVGKKQAKTMEPLQLEPAMTRKVEWTPPTNKSYVELKSSPEANGQPSTSSPSNWQKASLFRTLSDAYGCKEQQTSNEGPPQKMSFTVVKKRKLIELVPIKPATDGEQATVPEKPAVKRKASKKKQPRTITALATAAYKTPTQPDPAPPSASLLDYFQNDGKEITPQEQDAEADKTKKTRKKTTKVSKKKAPPPKPVLLSPRAAMKQVANQDFVFGTSSQLAREQSPSLLRDLQAAMQASNYDDSGDFVTPINSDAIEPPEQRPKLWDAGARDAEGDLLDLEVIDLVNNSPQLPPMVDRADPFGYNKNDADGVVGPTITDVNSDQANDDSFINLSDILPSPKLKPSKLVENHEHFSINEVPVEEPVLESVEQPTPANMPRTSLLNTPRNESTKAVAPDEPQRPKFELYTDAQLSREITSYGFKPVKRRTAMIALLDQCWESKVRMSQNQHRMKSTTTTSATPIAGSSTVQHSHMAADDHANESQLHLTGVSELEVQEPPPSAQPPLSPKRPRGRPRKDPSTPTKTKRTRAKTSAKKAAAPKRSASKAKSKTTPTVPTPSKSKGKAPSLVIEIPDSASEGASDHSITPCSSPEPTFSSPLAVDLSVSLTEDTDLSLGVASSDDQEALFTHVTKAVTTAPRTTDPSKPSWHEKILMYDPIVLEDLAAWLNSGQLTRVGHDGEISPGEVKQWCESKSICCLWKVNLRGKERKRL